MYSRIVGTGSHLPDKVLTNFDLEKMMDTTDEWIRDRTGIERRHIAADGETTVDLAEKAARRALDAAGVAPSEVDFIAFGTTTPDMIFPNCGVLLQERLGCRGGAAFSVDGVHRFYLCAFDRGQVRQMRRGQMRAGDRR
jgi:3-oxoacyl-[acyl-carrier-protein] synthase-3